MRAAKATVPDAEDRLTRWDRDDANKYQLWTLSDAGDVETYKTTLTDVLPPQNLFSADADVRDYNGNHELKQRFIARNSDPAVSGDNQTLTYDAKGNRTKAAVALYLSAEGCPSRRSGMGF